MKLGRRPATEGGEARRQILYTVRQTMKLPYKEIIADETSYSKKHATHGLSIVLLPPEWRLARVDRVVCTEDLLELFVVREDADGLTESRCL